MATRRPRKVTVLAYSTLDKNMVFFLYPQMCSHVIMRFFSVYIFKGFQSLWLQTIFYKAEVVRLKPNPSIFNLIALLEMREEWVLGVICVSWKITLKSKELQQHIFNSFLLFFSVTFFQYSQTLCPDLGKSKLSLPD